MTSSTDQASPRPRTRLIALGNEFVAGMGDPRAMGWLGRAVAQFNDGADRLDVFTSAVPQETSAELASRWEADVQRLTDSLPENGTQHRVVLGLGSADIDSGISLARSRLNLATVLDGLDHVKVPVFVVGAPPSADRGRTSAIGELNRAFHDVCARRRVHFVDPTAALEHHDQYLADIARSDRDYPSQIGYGLIAWLVIHSDFAEFIETGA